MTSSSGVSTQAGVRPLVQTTQQTSIFAPRPGYNSWGRPLKDQDVWGGIKTPAGKGVDTSDGIDEGEAAALSLLFQSDIQQFMHRLGADSKNGTPVVYRREDPVSEGATVITVFTARDGKLLLEFGLEITQEVAQKWLADYLAPPEKQITAPVSLKLTLTGEINRRGEIAALKAGGSLANVPRLSTDKLGNFEYFQQRVLRQLPVGETITEERRKAISSMVGAMLRSASLFGVELGRELVQEDPALKIDISREGSATAAHLKAGKNALDVQVEHLLDVAGPEKYPRVDGGTNVGLDAVDHDTVALGTLALQTTEKLVMAFENNAPQLYRIERDGSRTRLRGVFADLATALPFVSRRLSQAQG